MDLKTFPVLLPCLADSVGATHAAMQLDMCFSLL